MTFQLLISMIFIFHLLIYMIVNHFHCTQIYLLQAPFFYIPYQKNLITVHKSISLASVSEFVCQNHLCYKYTILWVSFSNCLNFAWTVTQSVCSFWFSTAMGFLKCTTYKHVFRVSRPCPIRLDIRFTIPASWENYHVISLMFFIRIFSATNTMNNEMFSVFQTQLVNSERRQREKQQNWLIPRFWKENFWCLGWWWWWSYSDGQPETVSEWCALICKNCAGQSQQIDKLITEAAAERTYRSEFFLQQKYYILYDNKYKLILWITSEIIWLYDCINSSEM